MPPLPGAETAERNRRRSFFLPGFMLQVSRATSRLSEDGRKPVTALFAGPTPVAGIADRRQTGQGFFTGCRRI